MFQINRLELFLQPFYLTALWKHVFVTIFTRKEKKIKNKHIILSIKPLQCTELSTPEASSHQNVQK